MFLQYLKALWEIAKTPKPETEHFKAWEFTCRDGTKVPRRFYAKTRLLMEQLEVLRAELGGASITVISGYRSPAHNIEVESDLNSQHLLGTAADIRVKGHSPREVSATIEHLIREGKMQQGGLGKYKSFVHYDIRGNRARWGSHELSGSH